VQAINRQLGFRRPAIRTKAEGLIADISLSPVWWRLLVRVTLLSENSVEYTGSQYAE
jgi:hypothetical protein